MSEKLNIAMFFGGNSSEHDVSKRSARNIYDAMDKEKYNVTVFLISKDGIMINAADSKRVFDGEDEDTIVAEAKSKMDLKNPLAPIAVLGEMSEIDLFYPVVHGNLGEDGTLQALFRLLQKPYIGPGTAASAMSFDKDLTKRILNQAGIRNTKYVLLTDQNFQDYTYEGLVKELGTEVLFVKAAKQGSSVGISRVTNAAEFEAGVKDALQYDYKVLVEAALNKPREVFISILGNEQPRASRLGGIVLPEQDVWYDYNNKFVDASGMVFELPVELGDDLEKEITDMALNAYKALGLVGLTRMDFMIDADGTPYLGEPNTLPGFTNISLYPQMWEVSGISYTNLIDEIINYGLAEFERNAKLSYDFVSLGEEHVGEKKYNAERAK
ncbi:D-alanine--D-alanine ligase family protein [Weissella cibaria]|uniref:D-alanine--D-alanine ligase family protein n=1 Tax=Weissella cibaria TaxID=137591 RepID=UPI0005BD33BC|nr:D-alanine--D-alanine ligase family protein [Weissella cibaria]ALI32843.1 D-alanine--D-alanine ligase [Weissella cibaria]KIU24306.1 D-alanine--D-alanine ligase [Weissella cibaria]MBD1501096.1 D-alanine--D-alanine ligase [Weissella cibaria]WCE24469.1 D-alanine--D-alanine ligase [Weissella cibaria]WCE26657.1 D-alanine--D-alanine ligase [Weissella cibaria]